MISKIILRSLSTRKEFTRKVLPHIKDDFFPSQEERKLFNLIKEYIVKYRNLPQPEAIKVEMTMSSDFYESEFENISELIDEVGTIDDSKWDTEWLVDSTEKWAKERALHNAILKSVELIEAKKHTGNIPEIVREALQVEFETTIGLEFLDDKDIEGRWKEYRRDKRKIPFGIPSLDAATDGGIEPKALSIILAGTHVGKTHAMVAMGCNMVRAGYNVLYVTLEIAEEKITQRADANFLGVDINDVPSLELEPFKNRLGKIKEKKIGRFISKEFPPATISTSTIRNLLSELKVKKNFVPHVIFVDYVNLMISDRVKGENSYTTIKSVVEELRGLAVEGEYSIVSATQGNRETNDPTNSNIDMTNVSESIGTAQTADFLVGVLMPEELHEMNLQIWKVLKNRFGGIVNHSYQLRVNFPRVTLTDVDSSDQLDLIGNTRANEILSQESQNRVAQRNAIVIEDEEDDGIDVFDLIGES